MTRARGPAAVLTAALLLTGCAQSVDPIERLGKKAAEGVRPHTTAPDQRYRAWGLARPLARSPVHPARPLAERTGADAPPPVIDQVPTPTRSSSSPTTTAPSGTPASSTWSAN